MTGAELIDAAISFYDNTNANDATNTARRARILHSAQMVLDEVMVFRPWPFKYHTITVYTVSGEAFLPNYPEGYAIAPAAPLPPGYFSSDGVSFGRLGPEGLVYEADTGKVWTETTLQELMALRVSGNTQRKLFAITAAGPDTTTTSWSNTPPWGGTGGWVGGEYKLLVPDTTSIIQLSVHHEAATRLIQDSSAQITPIPGQYHRSVLLAGTIARIQVAKSDVRIYWEKNYLMGLARMSANEMSLRSRVVQMPMHNRGMY